MAEPIDMSLKWSYRGTWDIQRAYEETATLIVSSERSWP